MFWRIIVYKFNIQDNEKYAIFMSYDKMFKI